MLVILDIQKKDKYTFNKKCIMEKKVYGAKNQQF